MYHWALVHPDEAAGSATMSEVIEMLEAGVDGIQMPPWPFFCDDEQGRI